jgi:predicted Rossmann fold nucleotide-binding protein DprA/Smf involved in DNA uptake
MTGQEALVALALKYKGDWDKMVQGVKSHECFGSEADEKAVKAVDCPYVTLIDKAYPESFKHCFRPPLVLFYRGDISLLKDENKCVSYIGSRLASPYGLECARNLAGGLAKEGFVIVSGLAMGIDAAATEAALDAGGKAVGVLGCGIDRCYPDSSVPLYERLKKEGLSHQRVSFRRPRRSASTFPIGIGWWPPRKASSWGRLPKRAAPSSRSAMPSASPRRSAAFLTRPDESACNILIKEGADMIENLDDVNLLMGYNPQEKERSKSLPFRPL